MSDPFFVTKFKRELWWLNLAYRIFFWSHVAVRKMILDRLGGDDPYARMSAIHVYHVLSHFLMDLEWKIRKLWDELSEMNNSQPKHMRIKIKPPLLYGTLAQLKAKAKEREEAQRAQLKEFDEVYENLKEVY